MGRGCFLLLSALLLLSCTAPGGGDGSTSGLNKAALPLATDETRALRVKAEGGDAQAQYDLAVLYYAGRGVPRNDAEAARWFRKAADQGRADAQFYTAAMYHQGRAVAQDYAEAAAWLRKSAEQGHAMAQEYLGKVSYDGQGVSKDAIEGYKWEVLAVARAKEEDLRRSASMARDIMAAALTPEEVAKGEKRAREWVEAREALEDQVREVALKTFCGQVVDPFFIRVGGDPPSPGLLARLRRDPRYRSIAEVEMTKQGPFEVPVNGSIVGVGPIEWQSDRQARLRLGAYRGPLDGLGEDLLVERDAAGQWWARVVPGTQVVS